MLLAHKSTGEFYTQEYTQVLDVWANCLSRWLVEGEEFETFVSENYRLRRGDEFQLVKTSEYRERTLKALCGSDGQVWSEAYQVKNRSMEVLKSVKWTGKKFVEVK